MSSERIARSILERLGYRILETNKKVVLGDAEAFEVDIIAISPEGDKCCVEVKAGRAGISDIRQIFADSRLLGLKPMLVCKGFADESAEIVSRELGVKMIKLSEYYVLLEPEELEVIVRSAVQDVLNEYGFYPLPFWKEIGEEDWSIIKEVSEASSFKETAKNLNLSIEELGHRIGDPRKRGIFPEKGQNFKNLKQHSQQLIQRYSFISRLNRIENYLKRIIELISSFDNRR